MPEIPPYDPDTQELVTYLNADGSVDYYEVRDKTQEEMEWAEDYADLETIQALSEGVVPPLMYNAIRAMIRMAYQIRKG